MKIFVDTGPLQAFNNISDQYYKSSTEILEVLIKEAAMLVTTDYIIDETYTGLLTKAGYKNAIHFDEFLKKGICEITFIDRTRFIKSQDVFRRFNKDKIWSFTDCTSYVVMKELGIKKVFISTTTLNKWVLMF